MKKTYECCPYCCEEVELDAELKVQVCPKCGKHIVTCSMCLNKELNYKCCSDCCLEVLAHNMNEEDEKNEDRLSRHEMIERLSDEAENRGGIIKLELGYYASIDDHYVHCVALAYVCECDHGRLIAVDENFANWDVDDYFTDLQVGDLFRRVF